VKIVVNASPWTSGQALTTAITIARVLTTIFTTGLRPHDDLHDPRPPARRVSSLR
jgi:hypothetical protein